MSKRNEVTVQKVYLNADMKKVGEEEMSLKDYVAGFRYELIKLITDIEDLVYLFSGGKPRSEWRQAELDSFLRIRHKLLDQANDIERLPQNIRIDGEKSGGKSAGEALAEMLNELDSRLRESGGVDHQHTL